MTDKMVGFTRFDGGRKAAGYKGSTGDCVVRAITIASDGDYKEIYDACASANKLFHPNKAASARNGVFQDAWHYVCKYLGFEDMGVKASEELSITDAYNRFGDCIVEIPRHLLAVKGGFVVDSWDSRFVRRSQRSSGVVHPKVTQVWRNPNHAGPIELPELDDKAKEIMRCIASEYLIEVYEGSPYTGSPKKIDEWQVSKANYAAAKRWADSLYFRNCYELQGKKWNALPFNAGYFKSGATMTLTVEEVAA